MFLMIVFKIVLMIVLMISLKTRLFLVCIKR